MSPAELLFNMKLNTRLNFVKPTLTVTTAIHKDNFCRFHYYLKNPQFYLVCSNSIIQQHVDQLRYMAVIDDIYDSNKQHQPKSWIATEKERHDENEHELVVPKPKTNLNRDIQERPIDLTPKETVTL